MAYIPHTLEETRLMLQQIGIASLDELYKEVPDSLPEATLESLPPAMTEWQLSRLMSQRAAKDGGLLNFIGAGAYEHHIPAPVWEIAGRGEFYTAYTPYQAEASQGTLQTLYEFQTMLAGLMAMAAANASLYDGASALAEAIRMALRANPSGNRRVLLPATVSPHYRKVVHALVPEAELIQVPYCPQGGHIPPESLAQYQQVAALVIPQPNFFGILEEVHALTQWVQGQGGVAIGLVNPVAMGLLAPPGQWGNKGCDIACGEGQPLGIPLASGGPYFGFICCRSELLRQMPGRIVGRTKETGPAGRTGFVLTLQAREQHIRRAKATSNICTNQGLMAIAAAIHMAILGPAGIKAVAASCHQQTRTLLHAIQEATGLTPCFNRPYFHEALLRLPRPVAPLLEELSHQGIAGGFAVEKEYPELQGGLLICATETRSDEDLHLYANALAKALQQEEKPC
ncbi:MAG: aminomethyl-transferring glycine dehydrogenase subunit GcvPA [Magnetococcales bacterium]|nr:aminomethyl-transferring glycine dehydrogenase subunit GcvPA [Magnetococcales bacterium]